MLIITHDLNMAKHTSMHSCTRSTNKMTPSVKSANYKHALYACPKTQRIIQHLTTTLFPNTTNTTVNIAEVLITNKTTISKDFDSKGGRELLNTVWDQYQILTTVNHTAGEIPILHILFR
jgi:hypothetical protein